MAGEGTIGKACDVLDQVAAFGRPVRFAELLDNSCRAKAQSPSPDSPVRVRMVVGPRASVLVLRDDGCGMTRKDLCTNVFRSGEPTKDRTER